MLALDAPAVHQAVKWFGNYVWRHPSVYRAVAPWRRWRAPATVSAVTSATPATNGDDKPLGLFFYPADQWDKTHVLAAGRLGELYRPVGETRIQIARGLLGSNAGVAEVMFWGHGPSFGLVKNLASGVSEGFAVNLELHGIGFRAEVDKERNKLVLKIGFSHSVEVELNDGTVMYNVIEPQLIQVAGLDYAAVHQAAARVRAFRPPEPYKGKGIRYHLEEVKLRETKKS